MYSGAKKLSTLSFDLITDCNIEEVTRHIINQPSVTKVRRVHGQDELEYRFLVEMSLDKDSGFSEVINVIMPQVWNALSHRSRVYEIWVEDYALTAPRPDNAVDFTVS